MIPHHPFSRDRLDQFGAGVFLGPFNDLLDATRRTQTLAIAERMGQIEKPRQSSPPANPQREFIGEVNDFEKRVVENLMLPLGVFSGSRLLAVTN
jgi:hypothetical protein